MHPRYEVTPENMKKRNESFTKFRRMDHEIILREDAVDVEIKNSIPVETRKCKFLEESDELWAFKYYSYFACEAECLAEKKLEICNCSDTLIGFSKRKKN